jgi:catechol 2,3-dioxygenase
MTTNAIHPAVRVGHVHLRVSDLDRAIGFYRDALGLGLTADGREAGLDAAFLAAGDYHHHVGLNTLESAGGTPPPPGHTGLYHVAFLYPARRELGQALHRLLDHGWPVDHATDHGGTAAGPSSRTTTSTLASCSSPRVRWAEASSPGSCGR